MISTSNVPHYVEQEKAEELGLMVGCNTCIWTTALWGETLCGKTMKMVEPLGWCRLHEPKAEPIKERKGNW